MLYSTFTGTETLEDFTAHLSASRESRSGCGHRTERDGELGVESAIETQAWPSRAFAAGEEWLQAACECSVPSAVMDLRY